MLYSYCTNCLSVISCQEQSNRLLVVIHHKNLHELASLRFIKLNLECQNIKIGIRTYEHLFFFLSWDYVLNQHHAIGYHSCFYSFSLFLKSSYYNSYTWSKNITLAGKSYCKDWWHLNLFLRYWGTQYKKS